MKTFIERLTYRPAVGDKDAYYTFWVKLFNPKSPEYYATISGFRYWPESGKLATPSVGKGEGKYVSSSYFSKAIYDQILGEVKYCLEAPGEAA